MNFSPKLLIDNSINEQKRQLKSLIEIANQILLSNKIVERDLEFKQEISKAEASLSQTNKTASELLEKEYCFTNLLMKLYYLKKQCLKKRKQKLTSLRNNQKLFLNILEKAQIIAYSIIIPNFIET